MRYLVIAPCRARADSCCLVLPCRLPRLPAQVGAQLAEQLGAARGHAQPTHLPVVALGRVRVRVRVRARARARARARVGADLGGRDAMLTHAHEVTTLVLLLASVRLVRVRVRVRVRVSIRG